MTENQRIADTRFPQFRRVARLRQRSVQQPAEGIRRRTSFIRR